MTDYNDKGIREMVVEILVTSKQNQVEIKNIKNQLADGKLKMNTHNGEIGDMGKRLSLVEARQCPKSPSTSKIVSWTSVIISGILGLFYFINYLAGKLG